MQGKNSDMGIRAAAFAEKVIPFGQGARYYERDHRLSDLRIGRHTKRFFLWFKSVGWILLIVLAVCTACARMDVENPKADLTPSWDAGKWKPPLYLPEDVVLTIRRGEVTMLMVVTDIVFVDDTDDQGEKRQDWAAVLWIQIRDKPETRRSYEIFPGKSIRFDQFIITILKVFQSPNGKLVEIEITQA